MSDTQIALSWALFGFFPIINHKFLNNDGLFDREFIARFILIVVDIATAITAFYCTSTINWIYNVWLAWRAGAIWLKKIWVEIGESPKVIVHYEKVVHDEKHLFDNHEKARHRFLSTDATLRTLVFVFCFFDTAFVNFAVSFNGFAANQIMVLVFSVVATVGWLVYLVMCDTWFVRT